MKHRTVRHVTLNRPHVQNVFTVLEVREPPTR
ncbi:1,4-dihydroxy-2-naphthoyl-CoA synthase [Paraburkholderia sp. MM5384-R2]|nr:1,4-dihydroxy-2-naphthoyl-CoA synthase [Paraburkholderia sp. MM5384-R2]